MPTEFSNKASILSDLWMNYRDEELFEDFLEYNDIGLPLAYMVSTDLATPTDAGVLYINETFDLFCAALELDLNGEYESLQQMLTMKMEE